MKRIIFIFAIALLVSLVGCENIKSKAKDIGSTTEGESDEITSLKSNASITGSNVNVRKGPGIDYKVVFQLDKGNRVQVLDKKTPQSGEDYYVLLAPYGTYPKGMAMKVLNAWPDANGGDGVFFEVEIELEGKKRIDTLFEYIVEEYSELHWEPVAGTPWYRIKVSDGRTGWVFGDFVLEDSE